MDHSFLQAIFLLRQRFLQMKTASEEYGLFQATQGQKQLRTSHSISSHVFSNHNLTISTSQSSRDIFLIPLSAFCGLLCGQANRTSGIPVHSNRNELQKFCK